MADTMEKLGNSLVQHGKSSDRVYLMKLDPADVPPIVGEIEYLAEANDYGKVFCKVPAPVAQAFVAAGYREEARIPRFFNGRKDAAFMSRFRKPARRRVTAEQQKAMDAALAVARQKRKSPIPRPKTAYRIRRLDKKDTRQLAALYRKVFATYPFPIFDPAYLRKTMATHIRYFGAFRDGQLVAASSAETDPEARNAEMTDFATDPDHRKKRLAVRLLRGMEVEMQATGFATLYTIARAVSVGMNATFARCGYEFGGTLINNTQIAGRIESMNVWYKSLLGTHPSGGGGK
ncbi:MAG: putative beta-lysine N-acetyltransferase [Sedimentisphaerales bacterium]|nr:putative beta-lysine N-acetyltransferase [Sedimentisphaerales bacterium]